MVQMHRMQELRNWPKQGHPNQPRPPIYYVRNRLMSECAIASNASVVDLENSAFTFPFVSSHLVANRTDQGFSACSERTCLAAPRASLRTISLRLIHTDGCPYLARFGAKVWACWEMLGRAAGLTLGKQLAQRLAFAIFGGVEGAALDIKGGFGGDAHGGQDGGVHVGDADRVFGDK